MRARRFRLHPAVAAALIVVVYGTVNIAAPLLLASLDGRSGWNDDRPGPVNLLGVVPLVAGLAIVVAASGRHAAALRARDWQLRIDPEHLLTPEFLVTDGLYAYSRNPLYAGDILMWCGWTLVLGSIPVGLGLIVLALGLSVGVRLEERGLARQFGDAWTQYCRQTPRLVGLRHSRRDP